MKFLVRNFSQLSPEENIFPFQLISTLVASVAAEAQYLGAGFPYAGLAGAFPYTGYAGLAGGYPYTAGLGYAAAVPFGSSTGLDPITQGLDPVTQGVAAPYAHYYGKRSAEAEPEADPQYLAYGGLGYAGLGYAGLPYSSYAGYAGYPYTNLGYAAYPGHLSACRNYVGAPVPC